LSKTFYSCSVSYEKAAHIALFDNLFLIQREVNALKHPALLLFPSSTAASTAPPSRSCFPRGWNVFFYPAADGLSSGRLCGCLVNWSSALV
jgi:hypothetical protein